MFDTSQDNSLEPQKQRTAEKRKQKMLCLPHGPEDWAPCSKATRRTQLRLLVSLINIRMPFLCALHQVIATTRFRHKEIYWLAKLVCGHRVMFRQELI